MASDFSQSFGSNPNSPLHLGHMAIAPHHFHLLVANPSLRNSPLNAGATPLNAGPTPQPYALSSPSHIPQYWSALGSQPNSPQHNPFAIPAPPSLDQLIKRKSADEKIQNMSAKKMKPKEPPSSVIDWNRVMEAEPINNEEPSAENKILMPLRISLCSEAITKKKTSENSSDPLPEKKSSRGTTPPVGAISSQGIAFARKSEIAANANVISGSGSPIRYVVNIPCLAKTGEDAFAKLSHLINLFKKEAFAGYENPAEELKTRLALVVGFNRKRSLLDEAGAEQALLDQEKQLIKKLDYPFPISLMSFFWEPQWEELIWDAQRKAYVAHRIPFELARKKLKEILSLANPEDREKIKKQIAIEEKKVDRDWVPFGEIRDTIKDHPVTTDYIREFQKDPNHVVYLSTIDADILKLAVDNNRGIFTEYDHFLAEHAKQLSSRNLDERYPETLCGGFRISSLENMLLHLSWNLAHKIQKAIASTWSMGVYYTETNSLIKIQRDQGRLAESFGSGADEMKQLQDHLKKTRLIDQILHGAHFVHNAAVTTTAPDRMLRFYNSYVFEDKLRFWDYQDFRTMRNVIGMLHPLSWAKSVAHGLPKTKQSGGLTTPQLNQYLSRIFKAFDPISYALDALSSKPNKEQIKDFYERLRKVVEDYDTLARENAQELNEHMKQLRKNHYDQATLQKIERVAQASGRKIAKFIRDRFDLEQPDTDILREQGFSCLGQCVKRLSKAQLAIFNKIQTVSNEAWNQEQIERLKLMDGGVKRDRIFTKLHIALFRQDKGLIDKCLTDQPDHVNTAYDGTLFPIAIAWRNQDEDSLIRLIRAGADIRGVKKEVALALKDIKRRLDRSGKGKDEIDLAPPLSPANTPKKKRKSSDSDNLESQLRLLKFVEKVTNPLGEAVDVDKIDPALFHQPVAALGGLTPFYTAVLFGKEDWVNYILEKTEGGEIPALFEKANSIDALKLSLELSQSSNDVYSNIAHRLYLSSKFPKIPRHAVLLELILINENQLKISRYLDLYLAEEQRDEPSEKKMERLIQDPRFRKDLEKLTFPFSRSTLPKTSRKDNLYDLVQLGVLLGNNLWIGKEKEQAQSYASKWLPDVLSFSQTENDFSARLAWQFYQRSPHVSVKHPFLFGQCLRYGSFEQLVTYVSRYLPPLMPLLPAERQISSLCQQETFCAHLKVVGELAEKTILPMPLTTTKLKPLHLALLLGNTQTVEALVEKSAEQNLNAHLTKQICSQLLKSLLSFCESPSDRYASILYYLYRSGEIYPPNPIMSEIILRKGTSTEFVEKVKAIFEIDPASEPLEESAIRLTASEEFVRYMRRFSTPLLMQLKREAFLCETLAPPDRDLLLLLAKLSQHLDPRIDRKRALEDIFELKLPPQLLPLFAQEIFRTPQSTWSYFRKILERLKISQESKSIDEPTSLPVYLLDEFLKQAKVAQAASSLFARQPVELAKLYECLVSHLDIAIESGCAHVVEYYYRNVRLFYPHGFFFDDKANRLLSKHFGKEEWCKPILRPLIARSIEIGDIEQAVMLYRENPTLFDPQDVLRFTASPSPNIPKFFAQSPEFQRQIYALFWTALERHETTTTAQLTSMFELKPLQDKIQALLIQPIPHLQRHRLLELFGRKAWFMSMIQNMFTASIASRDAAMAEHLVRTYTIKCDFITLESIKDIFGLDSSLMQEILRSYEPERLDAAMIWLGEKEEMIR